MSFFGRGPEFLTDGAIYARVRDVITKARKQLTIVSPYVDPTDDFIRQIQTASMERQVDVRLLFRRDRQTEYLAKPWLKALLDSKVKIGTVERLHSKIYASDLEIVLTSMNFYASSGENSFEAGVSFLASDGVSRDAREYLSLLERNATWFASSYDATATTQKVEVLPAASAVAKHPKPSGYCIRCERRIALSPERPYCASDYASWAAYENWDYEDNCCHGCGKAHGATMRKPLCRGCYKKLAA